MPQPAIATDDELMNRYLSGDCAAFEALYQRHSSKVYTYFFKRTQSRAEAEELTQRMFLKFHESRKNYDAKYPPLQWIYVISRTLLIDFYRKQGREIKMTYGHSTKQLDSIQPHYDHVSEEIDLSQFEQLTDEQRSILKLRVLDEASYEDIAAKLNKSESAVRKIVSRAFKKIKLANKLGVGL